LQGRLVPLESQVLQEVKDPLGSLDHKDRGVLLDSKVLQGLRAILDRQDLLDYQDLLDLKVLPVLVGKQETLGPQVVQVRLDKREWMDYKATLGSLDQ
jgi:hypothetical protein